MRLTMSGTVFTKHFILPLGGKLHSTKSSLLTVSSFKVLTKLLRLILLVNWDNPEAKMKAGINAVTTDDVMFHETDWLSWVSNSEFI